MMWAIATRELLNLSQVTRKDVKDFISELQAAEEVVGSLDGAIREGSVAADVADKAGLAGGGIRVAEGAGLLHVVLLVGGALALRQVRHVGEGQGLEGAAVRASLGLERTLP